MSYPQPEHPAPAPVVCYQHPDRPAGSVCRRCNRPICPSCMLEAPVGWQCTNCVKQGARVSPTVRWRPAALAQSGRLGQTRLTPVVAGLIAVNVVVYILQQAAGNILVLTQTGTFPISRAQYDFAMYPYEVHHGEYYRLITAAFMHANIAHILFNMMTLAIIGSPVEAEVGKARFLSIYLVAGLGGSVGSYLLSPQSELGLGASGALFGLFGTYFVLARSRRWDTSMILTLIVLNLVIGFAASNIDWRAHIGGLVTGAAVAFGLDHAASARRGPRNAHPGVPRNGWATSLRPTFAREAAVVVAALVVLAVLVQLPPGHVNL